MQNITIIIGISLVTFAFMIMADAESIITEAVGQVGPNDTQQQVKEPAQQSFVNTMTINLHNGIHDDGSVLYREIGDIETNVSELQGIKASTGAFSDVSARDDTLSITFPAKLPDPQTPNEESVMDIDVTLDVNSVVTKPDGLKIYYASLGFTPTSIGEFTVVEGVLQETSNKEAVLKLMFEQG
ncbi:MAG: hypothetical protein AB7U98_00220 [Candidatus Nitrosocosmicus sp.]